MLPGATLSVNIVLVAIGVLLVAASPPAAGANERGPLMNACAGTPTPGYWIEKLRDPRPATRIVAAQALGEIRDPTVVPVLVRALQDRDRSVRLAVVRALGRIGPGANGAITALRQMLTEDDADLRDEVRRSLARIASPRP